MMSQALQISLAALKDQGLLRSLRSRQGGCGRTMNFNGKTVLNFCSNDYLGLANDPRLSQAAEGALKSEGMGSGASRLVSGNLQITEELETRIATLKSAEDCLLFNSGFAANTGVIPALLGREDVVFSDRLNHASLIDGVMLSRAESKRYPHVDMGALEEGLKQSSDYRRRLIVTDSVFSMDGDVAPLKDIVILAKKYDAWVMVDEAHGFGVLGEQGGGLVEALGVADQIDIQMGTLSKSAGCFGAYVCGKSPLRSYLINHARSFIYTTALPASIIAAAAKAVEIIASPEGQQLRNRVMGHAQYLRDGLKGLGFDPLQSTTPIIPVLLSDAKRAVTASQMLLQEGIYVSAIRPPTVPVNTARLRITVSANHTQEDLDTLLDAMRKV